MTASTLERQQGFRDWVGEEFSDGLRAMEIYAPNAIQANAIPLALSGRDVMVCAQTGSGKTLMFLLPILHRLCQGRSEPEVSTAAGCSRPQSLILIPTDGLALQVASVARQLVATLSTPLSVELIVDPHCTDASCTEEAQLAIATPEALLSRMRAGMFCMECVSMVAVDEADAVLCKRDGSAPPADEILQELEQLQNPVQFFLTMSHLSDEREEELVCRFPNVQRVGHTGVLVPTLRQCYHYFRGDKEGKLLFILKSADSWLRAGTTLVFCSSTQDAERLCTLLQGSEASCKATVLHDDMRFEERAAAIHSFQTGESRLLVATDAAMRGLDFPLLRHVIMYDMPSDITAFVHSAGRTARKGQRGLVTCMVQTQEDQFGHFGYTGHHGLREAPALNFPSKD